MKQRLLQQRFYALCNREEEFLQKVVTILSIIAKNKNFDFKTWSNSDLKLMVQFLKQKPDDEKLPKDNKALMCQYIEKYKDRLGELNEYVNAGKHILPVSNAPINLSDASEKRKDPPMENVEAEMAIATELNGSV